ncbi:hypothetical protein C5167_024052 [Papaver somniferum]|uniref:Purple acid phosphatase n=1 Tax=Papaver somniferum TaxID=3469 RepID=A0A4Y7JR92_PAPSO|nr:hypothetical protein C5167_024052 [Papaver somniferum]
MAGSYCISVIRILLFFRVVESVRAAAQCSIASIQSRRTPDVNTVIIVPSTKTITTTAEAAPTAALIPSVFYNFPAAKFRSLLQASTPLIIPSPQHRHHHRNQQCQPPPAPALSTVKYLTSNINHRQIPSFISNLIITHHQHHHHNQDPRCFVRIFFRASQGFGTLSETSDIRELRRSCVFAKQMETHSASDLYLCKSTWEPIAQSRKCIAHAFDPVTVPFDENLRGFAVDLPDTDRVQRNVTGFGPEQISVSLSVSYDSVSISWITGEYQIGDNVTPLDLQTVGSLVRYSYGTLNSTWVREVTGYSLVYNQFYPFEGIKNYTSGIIHHVRLTGLNASTQYFYQCGDPSIPALSPVLSFKTMPISSPTSYSDRIAIVGDLGLTYNTTSTIDHLISNNPDLVLLVGDVCYVNLYLTNGTGSDCYSCSFGDTPIHGTYQPRWDYWGRYMQPLISKLPIMVVEGNHELEAQADNKTFVAYSSRFAFPNEESGSSSTFYYSFNVGGIHFVMLGAYIDYNKTGEQYNWLEKDLANVDRSVTPWLVATWHAPWYSSYQAHYREVECMRVAMEDLLYSYGVDLVFNGHILTGLSESPPFTFLSEWSMPMKGQIVSITTHWIHAVLFNYITIGDGGNREKMAVKHADEPGNCPDLSTTPDDMGGFCAFNFTSGPAAGKFCWDQQPDFSAYRESSYGHGILEMKNDTHALWTWHRNQDLYNSSGDQIYIVTQPDRCPVHP